jgi:hypothetical protein
MTSKITEEIVEMLRSRSDVGLKKYGVSMDRTDLSHADWCQHAIEELLDGAQYLLQVKQKEQVNPISLSDFTALANYARSCAILSGSFEIGNLYYALIEQGFLIGEEDAE